MAKTLWKCGCITYLKQPYKKNHAESSAVLRVECARERERERERERDYIKT